MNLWKPRCGLAAHGPIIRWKLSKLALAKFSMIGLRKVTAYPMEHPLECYGYRIEEHDKPGALNAQALKAAGVPPGPLFQELTAGKTIMLEDGRQINGADYLAAPVPGKALAIFGDTGPCDAALDLAKGVDVMVHEATLDITMEAKANSRGP